MRCYLYQEFFSSYLGNDDHKQTNFKDKIEKPSNSVFPFNLSLLKLFQQPSNKIVCKRDISNPNLMGQIAFNQENKNDEDDVIYSSNVGFIDQGDVDSIPCSSHHQDREEESSTTIDLYRYTLQIYLYVCVCQSAYILIQIHMFSISVDVCIYKYLYI
jgi:hypothetical protein